MPSSSLRNALIAFQHNSTPTIHKIPLDPPFPKGEIVIPHIIRPGKTLQQPAAEKSRAAGDEDALAAKFLPQVTGVGEDVIQVGLQVVCWVHGVHWVCCSSVASFMTAKIVG
jgi:hypothetical protein